MKKKFCKVISAALSAVLLMTTVPASVLAAPDVQKAAVGGSVLKLWYDEPAADSYDGWEKWSLPLGNSGIGASVFGGITTERIQLNEKSLWSGGPSDSRDYNGGNLEAQGKNGETMKNIQQLFLEGSDQAASSLCNSLVGLSDDAGVNGYGYYLSYGNMYLDFKGISDSDVTNYERSLDLNTAVASVEYDQNGTHYTRENFVSYPDNVLVTRISADGGDKLNLDVRVEPDNQKGGGSNNPSAASYQRSWTTSVKDGLISVEGALSDNQMKFASHTKVLAEGGSTRDNESTVTVTDADNVTIITSIGTDYKDEYPKYRTGESDAEVSARVLNYVTEAENKSYEELKAAHEEDFSSIFGRLNLDLGQTASDKTTDALLSAYKTSSASDAERRYLEVMLFQYGRYLTIESSRETPDDDPSRETLPSNLQGIWVGANNSAWHADYHMNVNLQMNYWPTYSTNMAECAEPLIQYVNALREPGRVTAKVYAGIESTEDNPENGFMAHTQNNPFGWTCPGWSFSWGWSPAAVPWILQNCWEYYEYTGDMDYLRENIYPMMREEAILYDQMLVRDGDGKLVSAPSYSPEHGPYTAGNTYEQSLIWQLYQDTIKAAELLDVDEDLVEVWEANQADLKGPIEIGDSGQIKEWYTETTVNSLGEGYNHRHLSHMLGLFPGDLISVDTPELLEAAKVSMNNRTDTSTGWGMGQRINTWARIGDGNRAYKLITDLFQGGILTNLWDTHAPYQIDGNFGYTSGVAEMLMQSNMGYINILPALPDVWSDGSVDGLVARGNFEIGINWQDGKATSVEIFSANGGDCAVQYTGIGSAVVEDSKGNRVETEKLSRDRISFVSEKSETYTIKGFQELAAAPANLQARYENNSVKLTWEAVAGADSYIVFRNDGDGYKKIAEEIKAVTYTDTAELDDFSAVKYKVAAVTLGAEGEQSDAASITGTSSEMWIDNKDSAITYSGDWGDWDSDDRNYNGTVKFNQDGTANDTVEMSFDGTGIDVVAIRNTGYGSVTVVIDGNEMETVSCAGEEEHQWVAYSDKSLENGSHTIKLIVNKDGTSTGKVEFDAFVVYQSSAENIQRTVTFATDKALASGSLPLAVNGDAGSTITLPAVDGKVTGYQLSGWSDGTATYAVGENYTIPSKNVTLTAVWTKADFIAIDKSGWTASAGSEENSGTDGPASWAIDGNTSTIWHSNWSGSSSVQPDIPNDIRNEFTIDFGSVVTVGKFEYMPRSGSVNGQILDYKILYSTTESGDDFMEIASGTWEANAETKSAIFDNTAMRRIQIRAMSTNGDSATNKFISAAEFSAYTANREGVVDVTGVTVDAAVDLESGESRQLAASVTPADATYKELTYTSSDSRIATVSSTGVVTANKLGRTGETVITVRAESGETAVCTVTVLPLPAASISLSASVVTLKIGETVDLKASVAPYYTTDKTVTWSVADATVASLNKGTVLALKKGKTTVTAATANGKEAVCEVQVIDETGAADKEALTEKITEAEKIVLDGYTEESVQKFNIALAEAKKIFADANALQEDIDKAVNALQDALQGLVKKENPKPDTTALKNALNDVQKLDLSGYTAASAEALRIAIAEAQKILADVNATEADIQKALSAVNTAKAGLVKMAPAVSVPSVSRTIDVGGVRYKVTKSASVNGTAAAVKLINKKKTKITIPSSVKIDGFSFKVTAVSAKAFQGSKKLKTLVIGSNVTSIAKKSFYKCSKLGSITFKSAKAPKIKSQAFKGIKSTCKVKVSKKMSKKQLNILKSRMKSAGAGKKLKYKK